PFLGCLGCSSSEPLYPVRGRVLYKNEPAKGVLVTFHLKGADPVKAVRPVGHTGEDGTFTLSTGANEGAAAGEYVVTFIWSEEVAPKAKGYVSTAPPEVRDRLQGTYANAAASKLQATIKAGENQLEPFQLK